MNAPGAGRGSPERILLIGMMGVGKTTIGRILSERLGWAYLDSDAQVEAAAGMTVPQLFEARGEAAFRAAEAAALGRALGGDAPVVVAVAGGAVLDADSRKLMVGSGTIVWLRARPQTLAGRLGDGRGRPLLGDDPSAAVERLDEVRRPLYSQLADVVVDVDGRNPLDVADETVRRIRGSSQPSSAPPDEGGGRS